MAKKKDTVTDTIEEATSPPATIRIKNRSKRIVVCNLPCKQYCLDACGCAKVEQVVDVYHAGTGEHQAEMQERKWCESVTWLAGETQTVNANALKCPEVASAVSRGELVRL